MKIKNPYFGGAFFITFFVLSKAAWDIYDGRFPARYIIFKTAVVLLIGNLFNFCLVFARRRWAAKREMKLIEPPPNAPQQGNLN